MGRLIFHLFEGFYKLFGLNHIRPIMHGGPHRQENNLYKARGAHAIVLVYIFKVMNFKLAVVMRPPSY